MRTAVLALLAFAPALARAQSLPTNQRLYDTTTSMPEVRGAIAPELGVLLLRADGARLVLAGVTTPEEVSPVCRG